MRPIRLTLADLKERFPKRTVTATLQVTALPPLLLRASSLRGRLFHE